MNFDELNKISEEKPARSSIIWIISLTDLISLILSFFVLLYATKSISEEKLYEIKQSFQGYLRSDQVKKLNLKYKSELPSKSLKIASNPDYIDSLLKSTLKKKIYENFDIKKDSGQIVINIESDLDEKLDITDDTVEELFLLSKALNSLSNQIIITAEADSVENEYNIAKQVSDKILELGFEKKILVAFPEKNYTENLEKNKNSTRIQIIIKNYESVF